MTPEEKKEFHRQKSKEHYAKYKLLYNERSKQQRATFREIVDAAQASGCIVCGEQALCALDFHHLGGKDMEVSKMAGRNIDRIKAEIAKCVVLCATCHRKVHAGLLELNTEQNGGATRLATGPDLKSV